MPLTLTLALSLSALGASCSNKAEAAAASSELASVLIEDVPFVRQKPDYCGEACVAAALNAAGVAVDQDWVFDKTGVAPEKNRGAWTPELKRGLEAIGYAPGPVWHYVPAGDDKAIAALFEALHADLEAGVPSIICTRYDERPNTTEHFRLILGYDADSDEVIYHEPAEDDGAYRRMKRARMLALWPLKYKEDRWTLIRLRLAEGPGKPLAARAISAPAAAPPQAKADAPRGDEDYARHARVLRSRLEKKLGKDRADAFTIIVERPFVVVGDEAARTVQRRAEGTVRWAVERLKKAYFAKDPDEILEIYLFKDERSYRTHAAKLFGHKPDTPFGYYSPSARALVMNISTGGGTLVHEIVHPFVAANFPGCPSWFNEGLGSLYEQSSSREGRIVGLTNWRLAGLQTAIKQGVVPTFKTLASTTTDQFYDEDPGTNYAQARYLLYYLQEKGLLERYYHAFHKARAADPTGYDTLKSVLGVESDAEMQTFQKRWEAWVLKLRFRG